MAMPSPSVNASMRRLVADSCWLPATSIAIHALIATQTWWASSVEASLEALGLRLAGIGNLDERDFAECVRLALAPVYLRLAQQLREAAERGGGGHEVIAADLNQMVTACLRLANGIESLGPADLAQMWGEAEALPRLRTIVKRFGELLRARPQLVQTARRLSCGAAPAAPGEGSR